MDQHSKTRFVQANDDDDIRMGLGSDVTTNDQSRPDDEYIENLIEMDITAGIEVAGASARIKHDRNELKDFELNTSSMFCQDYMADESDTYEDDYDVLLKEIETRDKAEEDKQKLLLQKKLEVQKKLVEDPNVDNDKLTKISKEIVELVENEKKKLSGQLKQKLNEEYSKKAALRDAYVQKLFSNTDLDELDRVFGIEVKHSAGSPTRKFSYSEFMGLPKTFENEKNIKIEGIIRKRVKTLKDQGKLDQVPEQILLKNKVEKTILLRKIHKALYPAYLAKRISKIQYKHLAREVTHKFHEENDYGK